MNAEKSTDAAVREKDVQSPGPDRIPAAVRKVMESTAPKLWPKIRAYLIGSEEEGELIEMLPVMHKVMTQCPPKLLGLIRKRKLSPEAYNNGFAQLHDSLHGVREAMVSLLHLAGYKVDSLVEVDKSGEDPGEGDLSPPPALGKPGAPASGTPPGPLSIRSARI